MPNRSLNTRCGDRPSAPNGIASAVHGCIWLDWGEKGLKPVRVSRYLFVEKMVTNKSLLLLLSALFLAVLPSTAFADSGHNTYQYLVGVDPLCSLAPSACPDIVGAPNGDTVAVEGQGTFEIRSMVATGSSTFVHMMAAGTVRASRTAE